MRPLLAHRGDDRFNPGPDDDKNQGCHDAHHAEEQGHRIGFADIADYLMGVDQIIHGDEIETHAKLIPEQPFCQSGENQSITQGKNKGVEDQAAASG